MGNNTYKSKLEFVEKLHATLDTAEILDAFYYFVHKNLSIDGLDFTHQDHALNFQKGNNTTEQFKFCLAFEKLPLGQILLYRKTSFSTKEVATLESYLCHLILPLKNALNYLQALNAALYDSLTKLRNRSSLNSALKREIKLSNRQQQPLSLLVVDIDNFKSINDQYGHLAGDKVLIKTSSIIKQTIRETDLPFRVGGEEFLVILNNTNPIGAQKLAERLREETATCLLKKNGQVIRFTVSVGLSFYQHKETISSFISRADQAMYKAKQLGKNKVISAH